MKKISVIIPSYNSSKTIERCILSVINTRHPSLEIIVVDDASSDNSCQIIERLIKNYPGVIRLIRHKPNQGPAKARNVGAEYAIGEYLFFLDADTEVFPNILDKFTCRIKDADAVTGIYYFEPLERGLAQSYKALLNYYFFSRKGVIEYEVFDASRAGIKAEVFRLLGGFNENLKRGADYENEEFGYRLCAQYRNLLDPSIVVKHMFPNFWKLTKNYFNRVALWVEIFLLRKKFESGGVTSIEIGISTVALFLAMAFLPFIIVNSFVGFICLCLFLIYLYGYLPFFSFVLKEKPILVVNVIMLNIYFTCVIAAGGGWGFAKGIVGISRIRQQITDDDNAKKTICFK